MDHRGSPCSGLTVQVYSVYYVLPKSVWGAAEYQTGRHPGSPVMPILVIIDQKDWDSVIHFSCQRGFDVAAFSPLQPSLGCSSTLLRSHLHTAAPSDWRNAVLGFGLYSSPSRPRVCVTTAAVSRGDGGLITDCSVFLPAPLGETHTVNWMRTQGGESQTEDEADLYFMKTTFYFKGRF